jgi:hypothetical protein
MKTLSILFRNFTCHWFHPCLRLAVLLLLAISTSKVHAQVERGRWLIGGGTLLDITTGKENDRSKEKEALVLFDLRAGKFIVKGLVVGLDASYARYSVDDFNMSTSMIGPFLRHYLPGNVFIGIDRHFGRYKIDDEETLWRARDLGFSLGAGIFLGRNVALEPVVSYRTTTREFPDANGRDDIQGRHFGFSLGFSLFLGQGVKQAGPANTGTPG